MHSISFELERWNEISLKPLINELNKFAKEEEHRKNRMKSMFRIPFV